MGALSGFGLTVAPEQDVQEEKTDGAVQVPVDESKISVDAAGTDSDLIVAQVQAKAADDVALPTPGELGLSAGQTKTVDVPDDVVIPDLPTADDSDDTATGNAASGDADAGQ